MQVRLTPARPGSTLKHMRIADEAGWERARSRTGQAPAWPLAQSHRPDESIVLDDRAHASIWWHGVPDLDGEPAGCVGHFGAVDEASAVAILNDSCRRLALHGCRRVVGPMDGTTWRRYRLIIDRGPEPPFLLEPDNPDAYPSYFTAAGFEPIAHYFSALNTDLSVTDPRTAEAWERFAEGGATIRSIRLDRFEDELRAIYALSIESFRNNFLYSPISETDFLAQYLAIRAKIVPELILLAEKRSELLGFMFGLPNFAQAARGEPVDTALAKTLAVRPGRSGAGLGSILMDRLQQAARSLGFKRVIHALMHESNHSLRISRRFGKPFRRYAIFARRVTP
jgi:L-amino acid N-acyltransferase YncA